MGFPLHHFCLQIRKLYSDKISWQNKGHFECLPKTYIPQSKLFPSDKMAREEEREEGHILYILQNFIFVLCKKCTCSVCKLISWEADYVNCAKNKDFAKVRFTWSTTWTRIWRKLWNFLCLGQSSSFAIWIIPTRSLSRDYFYSSLMKGVASFSTIWRPGWLFISTYPENCTHD